MTISHCPHWLNVLRKFELVMVQKKAFPSGIISVDRKNEPQINQKLFNQLLETLTDIPLLTFTPDQLAIPNYTMVHNGIFDM